MNRKAQQMFWNCNMENDITTRLREFIETEAKSCSMDFGCITPEYVYRMWGGTVAIEEISKAMIDLRTQRTI